MTERIFVKDIVGRGYNEDNLLSHAILECCNKKVLADLKGEEGNKYIEVDFKINGIPVKLGDFLQHLDDQLDRMIEEKARDMVICKLDDVTETLYEVEQAVKRIVGDRLNITISDSE